jgi:imidazolonepropionase-like amidohydrolase
MRQGILLALIILSVAAPAATQTTPIEGLRDRPPGVHALTGATVVTAPGRVVEGATVVVRDGVIEAVGPRVAVPADARVWDLTGRTLYPGFIDAYTDVGMRAELPEEEDATGRGAVYWSPQVRSFVDAVAELARDDDARPATLRSQGFAVAMTVPRIGMFRGQAAAISLGQGPVAERVIRQGVAQGVALQRDVTVDRGYPTSAMGAYAFIRQTLHDAYWHSGARAAYERDPRGSTRPELNAALAALGPVTRGEQPLLIETRNEEEVLRALALRDDFPVRLWLRGNGFEYRLLEHARRIDVPLILPVDFPATPEADGAESALNLSLSALRHWHRAPENPARLAEAGVEFALTSDGLANRGEFLGNVRRAVERGLPVDVALAALTTVPARYLGIEATHGTIEPGRAANLVVTDGDLFRSSSRIEAVWIDGRRFEPAPAPPIDLRGEWQVTAIGAERMDGTLTLTGTPARLTGTFAAPGAQTDLTTVRVSGPGPQLQITFPGEVLGHEGTVRLSASATATALHGWAELPDGRRFNWIADRSGDPAPRTDAPDAPDAPDATSETPDADGPADALPHGTVGGATIADVRPAMEYGRAGLPDQPRDVLIRGATIWTMGPEGLLDDADLHVRQGRVVRVGHGLPVPAGAMVIDAGGRHITPGLIDPHLHSGIAGGVNETGGAIVPEVRIGDVLTIDNIWMYRQLAGGLTTANLMHGSANPIGGQNQPIKLRWGGLPDDLRFEGAPRNVKFALGENVVRLPDRYPSTRMGVDEIIRDHFRAARAYEAAWQEWERNRRRGVQPRRDLRMDALVDILNGDIQVQSHSYRQDEILMLMRLVEDFDFRVKAFHHGVEAFKVAQELAAHGAGAVVWSDWSSFKIEAYDATTYNARILHDAGVLTALHSDNSQIAARMNWEAAKMLRTGMAEVDALALVTINPARILGIEQRVGSLEPGKDADFVVWSEHPLSTATRAEQTWIDGRRYFDIDEDRQLRREVEQERARLLQLVLEQR